MRNLLRLAIVAFAASCAALAASAPAARFAAVDPAGEPVPGARVVNPGTGDVVGEAGAGGFLELEGFEGHACLEAPGRVPVPLDVPAEGDARSGAPASGETERVVLVLAGTLHGRVLDTAGSPVAGARVLPLVPGAAYACLPHASTDARGAWELAGLPPGRHSVAVVPGPSHLGEDVGPVRVLRGRSRRVDVLLRPAVAIELEVVGADGQPLAGAEVSVIPEWRRTAFVPPLSGEHRERIEQLEALTDETGRAELERLPERDAWRLAVRHDAHAPRSLRVAADVSPSALGADAARAGDARREDPATRSERSERSGRSEPRSGRWGNEPAEDEPAEASDSGSRRVAATLRLRTGGGLEIVAVDPDGLAWPEPVVRLSSPDAPDLDLLADPLPPGDGEGRLVLDHLPPGEYSVELRAPGARPRTLRGVRVRDAKLTRLGEVVLEPGASIGGVVESADGGVVPGASVEMHGHVGGRRLSLEQETDPSGRFLFEGLDPDGRARLVASARGFREARLERVEAGRADVRIELEPGARVEGVVIDAESGEPVAGAGVTARVAREASASDLEGLLGDRAALVGLSDATGEDGAFAIDGLPVGVAHVRVEAPGFLVHEEPPVRLELGEPLVLDVALERGLALEGRVVDAADGSGVAGATVRPEGPQGRRGVTTDLEGGFLLEGIEEVVDLVVEHPDYRPVKRPGVEVVSSGALEIELEEGAALEGFVVGADGGPVVGAEVKAAGRSTLSGADGAYELRGLPSGRVKVEKTDRPGTYRGLEEAWVRLEDGVTMRHDFGGGARLVGRVSSAGEPAPGAHLSIWESSVAPGDERSGGSAYADERGEYAITGLHSGEWSLSVRWQDRHFGRSVTIPEGAPEHVVDVEIPELALGGLVRDAATGDPVASAWVLALPVDPDDPHGELSFDMQQRDPDGDPLLRASLPLSRDVTTADGRFRLLLPEPGAWGLFAMAPGYGPANEGPNVEQVERSRDDVVIEVRGAARVTVELRARESGRPVGEATVRLEAPEQTMAVAGRDVVTFDTVPSGVPVTIAAHAAGRAPATLDNVVVEPGEDARRVIELGRGGSLRLLVPPGALRKAGPQAPLQGGLALVSAEGDDLVQRWPQVVSARARRVAEGEWLVEHVPEGPLIVRLGDREAGRDEQVDVREGQEVLVDLR